MLRGSDSVDSLVELPSLVLPKPIELCEQGNFEILFESYYDKLGPLHKVKIHGYQPSDYLTEATLKNRENYISNIETKKIVASKALQSSDYISLRRTEFKGYQPIHYAVAQGNLSAVRTLVEKYKFSPKSHKGFHDALSVACYYGHFEVLRYLVEDCKCYEAMKDEERLLHVLSSEVREGKDANEKPYLQLKGTKGNEHLKIMQLLLKYHQGGKFKHTPIELLQLILLRGEYKHIEFLGKFLKTDVKTIILDAMNVKALTCFGGFVTPLIEFAYFKDNLAMVKELLNNGVIASNAEFILYAIRSLASDEMLKLLVTNSSSDLLYEKVQHWLDGEECFIDYVASLAANSVHAPMLDLLLATFGSCVDSKKQNALHYICKSSSRHYQAKHVQNLQQRLDSNNEQLPLQVTCFIAEPKTELLDVVSANCDVNASDKDGNTPMHIACLYRNWKVVKYLHGKKKVSIVLKNNEGMIPLHFINLHCPKFQLQTLNPAIAGEVDHDGNTLLHIACIRGNDIQYVMDLVTRARVPIHKPNKNGQIPLHFVPEWDWSQMDMSAERIVDLLSNSETGKAQDIKGNTPLHIACYHSVNASQLALVKYILHKKPPSAALYNKAGKLPIHIILGKHYGNKYYSADMALVESLLGEIDVNLPDENGNTPLHLACMLPADHHSSILNFSQSKLISFLLKSKAAFVQIQNSNCELPLHLLLKYGCCDYHLIKLLISPYSLCVQDKDGNTPLHIACFSATTCIDSAILLLVEERSSSFEYYSSRHFMPFLTSTPRLDSLNCLSLQNTNGHTPLQILLNSLRSPRVILEVVAMLCLDQAYKNDTTLCDDLCLHNCVRGMRDLQNSSNFVVLRALINPLNANRKDVNGDTLVHCVVASASEELLQYLLEQCSVITNIKNIQGNTPLHLACIHCRPLSVLKLLQIRSEDITALNEDGLAPIHLAVQNHNFTAVKYLQSIYKDAVSIVTTRGKVPIQLFFKTYTEKYQYSEYILNFLLFERATATCTINYNRMAIFFAECINTGDFILNLDATEIELMIQLMCSVSFTETEKYLKEKRAFLAHKSSLKSPPYCHINRTQLLHMAAWFGRTDILQYLISEENVDPQGADEKGRNALVYACRSLKKIIAYFEHNLSPSRDAIQLLIKHGCSIFDQVSNEAFYAEQRCNLFNKLCRNGNKGLVKAAITAVPDSINIQDNLGNTPLMTVIKERPGFLLELAKFLIQDSACDQTITNDDGNQALHLACQHDSLLDVVKLLNMTNAHGAGNKYRRTPVEIAIEKGNFNILKYLLSNAPIEDDLKRITLVEFSLRVKQSAAASLLLKGLTLKFFLEHQQEMSSQTVKFLLHGLSTEIILSDGTTIFPACKYNLHDLVLKLLSFDSSYSFLKNNEGDTPIHVACLYNCCKIAKILKRFGSDLSAFNSDSNTPLHLACRQNHYKVVKVLLRYGANMTAQNAQGDTPLHVACRHASYQCVKVLSTSESSNMQNQSGNTPLHLACEIGSYACVTALTKCSWSITNNSGDTPLHIACRLGSFSIVYCFIKSSQCGVNTQAPSIANDSGELPLHLALLTFKQSTTLVRLHALLELTNLTPIQHNFSELIFFACKCKASLSYKIARYLKTRGVRIDTCDEHSKLPIHYAASVSLELVKVCASSSNVNAQDRDGNTALHVACMKGRYSICKYLVMEMNCDRSIQNQRGEVALHKACNAPSIRPNICLLLLREDCFIPDRNGNYPLHYLCKNFSNKAYAVLPEMVKVLDALGLCKKIISHSNECQELPIHFLCKSGVKSAVNALKYLLPHTSNLDAKDLSGNAPIHLACLSERHDIIQLLTGDARCDIAIEDAEGNVPLHLACKMRLLINWRETLDSVREALANDDFQIKYSDAVNKSHIFNTTIECLATSFTVGAKNKNCDLPLHLFLSNYDEEYDINGYIYGGIRDLYCKILKTVISKDASQMKQTNRLGEFPIHIACQYQHLEAVKEVGVEGISGRTSEGDNIFHSACRNRSAANAYEVLKYLVESLGGNNYLSFLQEKNGNGNLPLHLYSMFSEVFAAECFKFLSEKSDINCKNDDGNTPFHVLLKNTNFYLAMGKDVCSNFIRNEKCDLTLANKKSETILDLIAKRGGTDIAREIVVFNSTPSRLNKLKHILSSAGEDFILMLYLSDADIVTVLSNLEIDPAPLYKAHQQFFNNEKEPLEIPISMLFIGDSMTGKTTLVNSLRKEAGLDISESEPERTAGIIPSSFQSSKYGRVTAYDFAGHREYYAGHEAVMQSILQKTPPIVLIHANLTTSTEKIARDIRYWSAFMSNRLKGSVSKKAQLFVVCSHADLDIGNKFQELSVSIESIISTYENFHLVRSIGMDCRESKSPEMNMLVQLLADTTSSLHQKGVASFKAHCLYVFLTQHLKGKLFITMNELFYQQRTIHAQAQMRAQNVIFNDFKELKSLCEELALNGQILLMRDKIARRSLILLRQEELLKEVSGKILAHREFPGYEEISSITGVVPFSKVKALFPKHNPRLIFQYLCSIEYCFEVTDKVILEYILAQEDISPSEHYYFFPEHVTEEYPDRLELWDPCKPLKFCWVLRCKDNEFFSPKFVQLLLLRLLFGLTRVEKIASKIWKCGLFWYNSDGIITLVNVIDTGMVIVLMQCEPDDLFELLRDRSIYLNLARDLQQKICPSLHCDEFFVHYSCVEKYLESTDRKYLVPMNEVCNEIRGDKKCTVTPHYNFKIQKLILFDPYTFLCKNLLDVILKEEYNRRNISIKFVKLLHQHFSTTAASKLFLQIFGLSSASELSGLMLTSSGKLSFADLRSKFDKISIFATSAGI